MHALDTASPAPSRRVDVNEEEGAQAVEYAMIGGLGAGLIGLLWSVLSRTGLVERIVNALLSSLVDLVNSWF
jgi:Flp pilus assembly pilin Flp